MTAAPEVAPVPVTIDNPGDWQTLAASIQHHTGTPPPTDAGTVAGFVGASVALLVEADRSHDFDLLRSSFSAGVIGQLSASGIQLAGCRATAVEMTLVGAPHSNGSVVVRVKVRIALVEATNQPGIRTQFWDIQMDDIAAVVGSATCPSCGAPLPNGALVCPYCHTDSRVRARLLMLVIRMERMS